MPGPISTGINTPLSACSGRRIVAVPFRATTNGANAMTIDPGSTYDGTLTVSGAGTQYTFVLGAHARIIAATVNSSLVAAPTGSIGSTLPTAGTVRIDFAAAQTNAQINGVFWVEL